mmetsp:Transcript_10142/g.35830  ORF Transcript_10142/g.35830 Transcript_10142/m.35830 type:complete len:256 (+) Transcript_10142:443-1210(+)
MGKRRRRRPAQAPTPRASLERRLDAGLDRRGPPRGRRRLRPRPQRVQHILPRPASVSIVLLRDRALCDHAYPRREPVDLRFLHVRLRGRAGAARPRGEPGRGGRERCRSRRRVGLPRPRCVSCVFRGPPMRLSGFPLRRRGPPQRRRAGAPPPVAPRERERRRDGFREMVRTASIPCRVARRRRRARKVPANRRHRRVDARGRRLDGGDARHAFGAGIHPRRRKRRRELRPPATHLGTRRAQALRARRLRARRRG